MSAGRHALWPALAVWLGGVPLALAQPAPAPDLHDLALDWARGEFASPVVCDVGGRPTRGARRILITPGASREGPRTNRLRFFDLDVAATRCYDAQGRAESNLIGTLLFGRSGASHPDTARHDFAAALRRAGGFEYPIRGGRLRFTGLAPGSLPRVVNFAGGVLALHRIHPGSDAARVLREYGDKRKLRLRLQAPDGTRLELPLVQYGLR